ncbi:import inner membrane translocase subunit Tim44 [Nitrosomonas sp. Is79A3]|uniref:TIM44-like domain-containing protein n=1 Tax=Nitrosomonas sp. (strain Is79A3) TaxID=261292 RepID=UPI000215D337
MKQTLTFLTLAIFSFGLLAFDAEAKRMGGGKNIGTQRQSVNPQQAAPNSQKSAAAAPAAAAAGGGSKWGGALAGLAAGGLLAALFMGGAFENINMMDMVMLALLIGAVFFVIRMLRKPKTAESTPSMQYSGTNTNTQDRFSTPPFTAPAGTATADNSETAYRQPNIPADFKVEPFIRNAKASFMRLQTAHDHGDVNEIRDYTTPEMLAEISAQINERGDSQQKTEVLFIDANLLEVETTNDMAVASVRFTGQLRDAPDGEPEAFDEIWHVQKDLKNPDATWLLAGIQQVS